MPTKISQSKSLLPTTPIKSTGMPSTPIFLTVGPPGFGKTEFVLSNPRCLLAACQRGHEGVDGFKVAITSWDDKEKEPFEKDGLMHLSFMQLVKELETNRESIPYDFLGIDTIDDLIKMLVDESNVRLRVKHLSDLDYGKGYDLGQNTPFRRAMNRLNHCGLGIVFITHEDTTEKTFKGVKQAKKETTLPTGIYKQIFPMVTAVLHGVFGKKRKGKNYRDRIFVTEGSESMLAKNRYGVLPVAWLVSPDLKKRWSEFVSFWNDPEGRKAAATKLQELGYDLENDF